MKRKLSLITAAALVLATLTVPVSGTVSAAETSDADVARQVGQAFVGNVAMTVPDLSKWKQATLVRPRLYHDLDGDVNAYMFAIQNGAEVVGHVLVGSSAYGFPVFEAGEAAPPSIPADATRVLYLGVDRQYALREANGEVVGVNLTHGDVARPSDMKSFLPTPVEYASRRVQTNASKPGRLHQPEGVLSTVNFLTMGYYLAPGQVYCGPCSGVSIGHYYKWYSETGRTYPNLYDDYWMYEVLYDYMQAQPAVWPQNYGPGFVNMGASCGYYNFRADGPYTAAPELYFNLIVPSIDSGWPGALCTYPWASHWRAIKGYDYNIGIHFITCTNSQTRDSWEYLNWDSLPDQFHDLVRIRDNG